MMSTVPEKGWRTISIREEQLKELKRKFKNDTNRPSDQKFSPWLEDIVSKTIENEKKIMKYGPFLKILHFKDTDEIILYDYKPNKVIHVYIRKDKKELQCDHCKKTNCIHIGFCYGVKEICDKLLDLGFRPSSSSSSAEDTTSTKEDQ